MATFPRCWPACRWSGWRPRVLRPPGHERLPNKSERLRAEATGRLSDCFDDCGLVSVLDDYEVGPAENQPAVHVVYSSARYLSPKIRAFIDFFHEELKELNSPARIPESRS